MIRILDFSHWEGKQPLDNLSSFGYEGIYTKASEAEWEDETYDYYYETTKKYNLPFGAFHYFRMNTDPIKQANFFYSVAKDSNLPPSVDVENIYNTGYDQREFSKSVQTMVERVAQLFGRKILIYSSYFMWKELIGNYGAWASDYMLWVANYQVLTPKIPTPWVGRDWFMWQYTAKEPYRGSLVDCSYFNGSKDELYKIANINPPSSLEQRISSLEERVKKLEEILK